MKFCRVLPILLLLSIFCVGQELNKDGLKKGQWRFRIDNSSTIEEGQYSIIPLSDLDTVKCSLRKLTEDGLPQGWCYIRYNGREESAYINGLSGDSVSIKTGIWRSSRGSGHYIDEQYEHGVRISEKEFNSAGELLGHDYITNDSSISLDYISGRVFKKEFYHRSNKANGTIYYPGDPLKVSSAELALYANFLSKPSDTATVTLSSVTPTTITEIHSKEIIALDSALMPVRCPLYVSSTPIRVNFVSTPRAFNCNIQDTVYIKTKERPHSFYILARVQAAHIDGDNVSKIDTLTLSKSIDKFLWIKKNGTENNLYITDQNNKKQEFSFWQGPFHSIDISGLTTGTYKLEAAMEDVGNKNIILKIVE